eukprot:NODE_8183_length_1516_cov_5.053996.p1 GENE.NODE_8183_length_1516_cov_5.053996~~NODE_8183_length_1516_cov_5.053996.p1  ORF type:complete len:422 (-),score=87.36 NODE_8183_length_1516_cov_5.053996:250-1341(-)
MSSKKELAACRSLLDMMCDAVVELDSNFCLKQHSMSLATMLITSSQESMKGTELSARFLTDEDRHTFHLNVSGVVSHDPTTAKICHVRLRGSLGEGIHVELFHVYSHEEDDEPLHLVGVREYTDVPPLTRSYFAEAAGAEKHGDADAERSPSQIHAPMLFDGMPSTPAAMMVGVDALSLTIVDSSKPLRAFLGYTPFGTSLLSWLGTGKDGFLTSFCGKVNEVASEGVTSADLDLGLLHFHIRPPGRRRRIKMSAFCNAVILVASGSESTLPADAHEAALRGDEACQETIIAFIELRGVHNVERGAALRNRSTRGSHSDRTGGVDCGDSSDGSGCCSVSGIEGGDGDCSVHGNDGDHEDVFAV